MVQEVSAALVVIGNEVLSGRTQDLNLRHIALGLNGIGVRLREVRVIADVEVAIIAAVNELRPRHDYVFTTGGIGPTHDDITAGSIAKAFGVELRRDPEAVERLSRIIRPEDLNEARLRMADIPEGGELIDNPVSQAPGFRLGNVYVMAGVPRIMQGMFDGLLPTLKGGAPMLAAAITLYTREGTIATPLAAIQDATPDVEIGSYPFFKDPVSGTVIIARGTDTAMLTQTIARVRSMAEAAGVRTADGDQSPA